MPPPGRSLRLSSNVAEIGPMTAVVVAVNVKFNSLEKVVSNVVPPLIVDISEAVKTSIVLLKIKLNVFFFPIANNFDCKLIFFKSDNFLITNKGIL